MISPLWSTSELLVSDSVLGLTSDLQLRARNRRVSKCGMADASTSRVRGRSLFLRFLFIPFGQAPYSMRIFTYGSAYTGLASTLKAL